VWNAEGAGVEAISTSEVVAGEWIYVVGTLNGTTLNLYFNGVLEGTGTFSGTRGSLTSDLAIGRRSGASYFKGAIDEVRIYNRALSTEEVQDLYDGIDIRDGLVAHWGFEEDYHFGRATYEFEDSTNQYYGLQNINNSWVAFFAPDSGDIEFLVFDQRPTGLEISADEDEYIYKAIFTLKKGTRVYGGYLYHSDVTRDTDADGVPDFLEEGIYVEGLVSKRGYPAW